VIQISMHGLFEAVLEFRIAALAELA
jgi:hypothetical protein